MKDSVGSRPLSHVEKMFLGTAERLEKANAALRSLRALIKKQHRELEELRLENANLKELTVVAGDIIPSLPAAIAKRLVAESKAELTVGV